MSMVPYGDAVVDRQTGADPLGIQPPPSVAIMHVCARKGMPADCRRRPDRARVVVVGGPHRLHDTSVDVPPRIAEPSYLLADQILQDHPAAHRLCVELCVV